MTGAKALWLLGQFMEGLGLIAACMVMFLIACWLILKIEQR